jgi:hypothetical protein
MVGVAVPPAESASYLVDVVEHVVEHEAAQLADSRVGGSDAARDPASAHALGRPTWMRLKYADVTSEWRAEGCRRQPSTLTEIGGRL